MPANVDIEGWSLACPGCRSPLIAATGSGDLACPSCDTRHPRRDGILRLLTAADADRVAAFLAGYRRVRAAEGWGSDDPAWHRALPEVPATDPHRGIWRIRARSLAALRRRVLADLPSGARVLDLGAGCCWLSGRLAAMGFAPAAIDINDDPRDGLGAGRHLGTGGAPPAWPRIQATFDRLPLPDRSADAIVWNASLHYAADLTATLAEGLRVLRPGGLAVVVDSPIYGDPASGRAMVAERAAHVRAAFGLEPAPGDPVGYLAWTGVAEVGAGLGLRWSVVRPWYGVRWALRPWRSRIRGAREPATFAILVGRRS